MDEMYKTGRLIAKFEYETHVGVVVLFVWVVFGCLVYMIRKIGLYMLSLRFEREYP